MMVRPRVWLAILLLAAERAQGFVTPVVLRDGGGRHQRRRLPPQQVVAGTPQQVAGELVLKLGETLIQWGVPAFLLWLIVAERGTEDDGGEKLRKEVQTEFGLNPKQQKPQSLGDLLTQGPRALEGSVPSYLRVARLDKRLESFNYDLTRAAEGRVTAEKNRRRKRLEAAFGDVVKISEDGLRRIANAEKQYKIEVLQARRKAAKARAMLRATSLDPSFTATTKGVPSGIMSKVMAAWAMDDADDLLETDEEDDGSPDPGIETKINATDDEATTNTTVEATTNTTVEATTNTTTVAQKEKKDVTKVPASKHTETLRQAAEDEAQAEAKFLSFVSKFTPDVDLRNRITRLVFASAGTDGNDHLMNLLPQENHTDVKPRVFVLRFYGDIEASQTKNLRQEITALLEFAVPGRDEVILRLSTGGGTVTGYGAAAGQLLRLKRAGIPLTIAVEEVAASGGYMMACAGDHVVASPFAIVGSIGVISDIPNVYERLKREGVEFQTVTAGKFKRTLTPTKKPTKEDFDKQKQELENVLDLFKAFVKDQRPSLDIDDVATGDTWYGQDAIDKGLVDDIITFDDLALQKAKAGAEVYAVRYAPKALTQQGLPAFLFPSSSRRSSSIGGLLARAIDHLLSRFVSLLLRRVSSSSSSYDHYLDYSRPTREPDPIDDFDDFSPPPRSRRPSQQPLYMADPDPPVLF